MGGFLCTGGSHRVEDAALPPEAAFKIRDPSSRVVLGPVRSNARLLVRDAGHRHAVRGDYQPDASGAFPSFSSLPA